MCILRKLKISNKKPLLYIIEPWTTLVLSHDTRWPVTGRTGAGSTASWPPSRTTWTSASTSSPRPTGRCGASTRTAHLQVAPCAYTSCANPSKRCCCEGLVGQLQHERSDIGWANLFMVPDRMKYIDFTEPYRIENARFMLSKIHQ